VTQKLASSGSRGEGRLRDEDVQLAFDRKRLSPMSGDGRTEERSFVTGPMERVHQHSPFRSASKSVITYMFLFCHPPFVNKYNIIFSLYSNQIYLNVHVYEFIFTHFRKSSALF